MIMPNAPGAATDAVARTFDAYYQAELARWPKVGKEAGISPD